MAERTEFTAGGSMFDALLNGVDCSGVGEYSPYDFAKCKRAFADADLVNTCLHLLNNDLNVSRTAEELYMHRNTLIYRVKKLKKMTGLDVCTFNGAVDFLILYRIYIKESKK